MDEYGTNAPPRKRGRSGFGDPFDEDYTLEGSMTDILIDDDPFNLNSDACWVDETLAGGLSHVSVTEEPMDVVKPTHSLPVSVKREQPPPTRPQQGSAKPARSDPQDSNKQINFHGGLAAGLSPLYQTAQSQAIMDAQQLRFQNIKPQMEQLRWFQREILAPNPSVDAATQATNIMNLAQTHKGLHLELESILQVLETLFRERILESVEIHRISVLRNELQIELRQLEVYEVELIETTQPSQRSGRIPAALIISKQPFPKSIRQNKLIESGVAVRLLSGALQNVWPIGLVHAEIVSDFSTKSKKNPLVVNNHTKELEDGVANFHQLVFPYGTRKKAIHLKFKCEVQYGKQKTVLESNLSAPFIVKTNENQYMESEGILLKYEAFGNANETNLCRFANALQKRYLMVTKQDKQKPKRPISLQDFQYIFHAKFIGNAVPSPQTLISAKQLENFWTWFGPGLCKIRYQRHLNPLWVGGYICGFVSKSESEQVLESASAGAFLIRFSEQYPGQFAIAYVPIDANNDITNQPHTETNTGGRVRHYLMQRDDVFASKKTLPDFLGRSHNLSKIVQIINDPAGGRIYQQCNKDEKLGEYYSKAKVETSHGYDKQLD